jgi:hypothetical protein
VSSDHETPTADEAIETARVDLAVAWHLGQFYRRLDVHSRRSFPPF